MEFLQALSVWALPVLFAITLHEAAHGYAALRFGDDTALAMHLLEHGVAIVPASAFGGRDGFRISFATGEDTLREAIRRIASALE